MCDCVEYVCRCVSQWPCYIFMYNRYIFSGVLFALVDVSLFAGVCTRLTYLHAVPSCCPSSSYNVVQNKSAGRRRGSKSPRDSRIPSLLSKKQLLLQENIHAVATKLFEAQVFLLVLLQFKLDKVCVLRNHKSNSNPIVCSYALFNILYLTVFSLRDKNNN